MTPVRERLKVTIQPKKLRIESEPYPVFVNQKYCVGIDVLDTKSSREYYLIIDPQSLSGPLHELKAREGKLTELVIWVNKQSEEKYSKYEVQLA